MGNAARNQSITHWNFHKIEVGMRAEWRMGTPRPFWEDWQLLEFGRDPPGTYFFSLLSCQSSKYEDKTELSPKCMKDGTEKETMKDSLMEDSCSEVQKKSVEQFTRYGMRHERRAKGRASRKASMWKQGWRGIGSDIPRRAEWKG